MLWIVALITIAVAVVLILGGSFVIRKLGGSSGAGEKDQLVKEIEELNAGIARGLKKSEGFYSREQLEAATGQLQEAQVSLDTQKRLLKEVESKLEEAQKTIEEKEAYHQSMKSARAEDEEKVTVLLARFDDIAAESISLEQRLAASMKSLDQMMTEIQLTQEQAAMFADIQNTLTDTSSQLRQLYIEYEAIKKRIDTLNAQLEDLEGEYTKLVEQQLGE